MPQDETLLKVPVEKAVVRDGVSNDDCMDGAKPNSSYFSLGNEKSVVEMPALPAWMINTPMHSKLPMIDAPKGKYVLFTTGLCEKIDCTPSDLDFDASPQTISVQYKSLHDPHLKWHYTRSAVYKRLVKNGFITSDGKVLCTLKEFNEYHQYLKQIRLSKIKQDRKRTMEANQKKIRKGVKKCENEQVRDIRAKEAKERKKNQEKEKEARFNAMLSLEKLRCIRLEEKLRLKQKHKTTCMRIVQEKVNGLKAQQAMEEKKRKATLLRKRSLDDKKRAEKLEKNRLAKQEERERKLEKKWNLRERLREMHLLREIAEEEKRQQHMSKDIAERDATVEQARARQRAIFYKIKERRANEIKEKEELVSKRLDVKLKKVQERFQKRSQPKKTRTNAANSSRRCRFSSSWSLERTLTSPDHLNPCDDSWIKKLKEIEDTKSDTVTETHDKGLTENSEPSTRENPQKVSTHSLRFNESVHSTKNSLDSSLNEMVSNEEDDNMPTFDIEPRSVDSLAKGLICNILQDVAEEEGYDGYYLSPRSSQGGSENNINKRSSDVVDAIGGSDGEDDWYTAANNIVGQAIDSAIEYLENNLNLETPMTQPEETVSVAQDNIRRQSIVLSSVLNMMDDTSLDLHYVSSSEEDVTDCEDEEEDIIGIIDNTASSTNGDGDWQAQEATEQFPVPPNINAISSRRRSVNEAILAPETLRGFHELEEERATSSEGALRLGGRRMSFNERNVQRRHTVPDIVPVFNDIQLNIDQNTVDSNLAAISVKPNNSYQMAHKPLERNSFRDVFKPDMTNCKGTAECLRGVLTQQLSQRRASLRSGDIQEAHNILVEQSEEELHHEENVMTVDDVGGFCYLPKRRTYYQQHQLEDVSENVTEELEEEEEMNDENLDMFADQMVSDVLKRVQCDLPATQVDNNERSDVKLGEDGVLDTTHRVHAEIITETDESPGVVISTVSKRSKNVDDVEWYNEWLPGTNNLQGGKSSGSRTSKKTKSKESTKSKASKSSVQRRKSATSHHSKRSNSAKSFKEALRRNGGKTRVVASEPLRPTVLISDASSSSINSRTRRRSESFLSRFVSSVKDFFTSSRHKTSDDNNLVATETKEGHSSMQTDRRVKSLDTIETTNHDSLKNERTQSMHLGSDTENMLDVQHTNKAISELSTKNVSTESHKSSHNIIDDRKKMSVSSKIENGEITQLSSEITKKETKDTVESTYQRNECSKTSLKSGTKNEITTDEIDAIRNALQPGAQVETNKPTETPPVSATRLHREESHQEENIPSLKHSAERKAVEPRPPSKKREHPSSSSLRRPVTKNSSHRKVRSEVGVNKSTKSLSSCQKSVSSIKKGHKSDTYTSSAAEIYSGKSKSNNTSRSTLQNSHRNKISGNISHSAMVSAKSSVDANRFSAANSTKVNASTKASKTSHESIPMNVSDKRYTTSASKKASESIHSINQSQLSSSIKIQKLSSTIAVEPNVEQEVKKGRDSQRQSSQIQSVGSRQSSSKVSKKGSGTVSVKSSSSVNHLRKSSSKRKSSTAQSRSSSTHSETNTSNLVDTMAKEEASVIEHKIGSSQSCQSTKSQNSSQSDGSRDLNGKRSSQDKVDQSFSKTSCHSAKSYSKTRKCSQSNNDEKKDGIIKTPSSCQSVKSNIQIIGDTVKIKTPSQTSQQNDKRSENVDKTPSKNEVKISIDAPVLSSTSCHKKSKCVLSTASSKTLSQCTENQKPDKKTSSKTSSSLTDCQSANIKDNIVQSRTSSECGNNERSQDVSKDVMNTANKDCVKSMTELDEQNVNINPAQQISSTSQEDNVEAVAADEKFPKDTENVEECIMQQASIELKSSSSGRLLSRPQSDQNRLRPVNEEDIIATSDLRSTGSNLPEISRPSSAEIVLNTSTFDCKLETPEEQLERPKSPEPPVVDKE
ncbi:uncharacterized protein [Antedon mediterranea]|uniref:uncharacterized protein n=1 Tax=Antedon mediterranea TaxID=105859 RepID=UPI003AF7C1C0